MLQRPAFLSTMVADEATLCCAVHFPSLVSWENMLGLETLHLECRPSHHDEWFALPSGVRHTR